MHRLASDVFTDYDSPMPAFTLMGEQGSALLDSALALPRQSAFGKDAYPSVFDKAAVLFRSLTKNHAFVDGNKRMAVMATVVFLFINDHLLLVSPSDLVAMALEVANSPDPSLPRLSQWLRRHSMNYLRPKAKADLALQEAVAEGRIGEDATRVVKAIADWVAARVAAQMYSQQKE